VASPPPTSPSPKEVGDYDNVDLSDLVKDIQAKYPEVMQRLAENEASPEPAWRKTHLAREMCRSQGYDPDMMVVNVKSGRPGPFGSVGANDIVPAWTLYVEIAEKVNG
jgi:hypothetical protein